MTMRGWIGLLILLLAGLAQAVNTTATLNDKSWVQSQQGLIRYVEPATPNAAGASDPNLAAGSNEGLLGPMLESEANLTAVAGSDPTASPILSGDAATGPSADGLIRGADDGANWANDPHLGLTPKNGAVADFVDASSRVELPAFGDIDWVATPLPTVKKTSIMEIVVFPALGMLVLILLVTWLVLRIRRNRPLDREQQLLHV